MQRVNYKVDENEEQDEDDENGHARGDSDGRGDGKAQQQEVGTAADPGKIEWVECERCKKWRALPLGRSAESLPDHWFCELNDWDIAHANCEAPEQTDSADEDESTELGPPQPRLRSRDATDVNDGTRSERSASSRRNLNARRGAGKAAKRGRHTQPQQPNGNSMRSSILKKQQQQQLAKSEWVQCETCHAWRRLPPDVAIYTLPDHWFCHMNTWDPSRANCSAPQESDEPPAAQWAQPAAGGNGSGAVGRPVAMVRLPDGVNLYGGAFVPATAPKTRRGKPASFPELIVAHYRQYNRYDGPANSFLNTRYAASSLFVPRGNVRPRGVARAAADKGLLPAPPTFVGSSTRRGKGIASEALLRGPSSLQKLLKLQGASAKAVVPPPRDVAVAALLGLSNRADGIVAPKACSYH